MPMIDQFIKQPIILGKDWKNRTLLNQGWVKTGTFMFDVVWSVNKFAR